MSRKAFFDSLRANPHVFGKSLKPEHVKGVEAILDSAKRNGVTHPDHISNVLSQVYHETGGYMLPIKETVYASHKNKNPSDATVIRRLDKAWAAGKLPWVRKPYWRDGWFGRGPIQLTHEYNYRKMGNKLNVPLVARPELALDPDIGADIAVVGMRDGMFRGGRKLADYHGSAGGYNAYAARAIVNGDTRSVGPKIKRYHEAFRKAIDDAGGVDALYTPGKPVKPPQEPDESIPTPPAPKPPPLPEPPPVPPEKPDKPKGGGFWAWLLRLFGRKGQ